MNYVKKIQGYLTASLHHHNCVIPFALKKSTYTVLDSRQTKT